MSKANKREEKIKCISFLRKMNDLKSELFEKFSDTNTKETRRRAWQEMHEYAVSIGLISKDKDFLYVRDTTWPNLRQRTMTKVDRMIAIKKTGEGGGPDSKLDDIDNLVLEVIGKDSPVVQGLGIPDTMGLDYNSIQVMEEIAECGGCHENVRFGSETVVSELQECNGQTVAKSIQKKISTPVFNTQGNSRNKAVIVRTREETKVLETLKRRRLELEIRKLELEVWEKETSLGVPHCTLTCDITSTTVTQDESTSLTETNTDIGALNNGTIMINDEAQLVLVKCNTNKGIITGSE